jgi:hypothetical protein
MIEVFKTNVNNRTHADQIIHLIHKIFPGYKANFDLDDCDKILRIDAGKNVVRVPELVGLLKDFGCCAEVLPD